MVTYVYRNGQRLTPYMLYQIERLNTELHRLFGVWVIVSSAIRLAQEQIDIFLNRYVTAGNIRGRRVYDTRVWRGVRYYRISSAGTVAVPSTSNHEIQGSKAAVDIRDTGSDAGITVRNSRRGRWIRQNAHRFGLIASGDGFREGWHFDILNIFAAVPGGGGGSSKPKPTPVEAEEEDDMPKNSGVWYKRDKSTYVYLVFNTGSGFAHEFSNGTNAGTMPGTYTAQLKVSMDIAGWSEVTESHARVIKIGLAAVRPKDAPKEVEVTIVTPEELAALDAESA